MAIKLPKEVDWAMIGTVVFRIFLTGISIGGIYAASMFATKNDVVAANAPYKNVPPRLDALEKVAADRGQVLRELADWRAKKDEVDTRLTVLVENQQKLMDRQQQMIDRQQGQIEAINARRP